MAENDPKKILDVLNQAPRTTRADGYKTIYINGVKMGVSPWDFRITFSQTNEANIDEITNEEQITIVMSPQHAKVALKNWVATIKLYEDTFGEIPDLSTILEKRKGIKPEDGPKAEVSKKSPTKKKL